MTRTQFASLQLGARFKFGTGASGIWTVEHAWDGMRLYARPNSAATVCPAAFYGEDAEYAELVTEDAK